MPAPYLRTKLLAPQLHPQSIVRERLVDRLVSSPASVWLLSAPAGYGKTTVVTQALERQGGALAWISVDAADNDAVRLWTHVAAAVMGDGDPLETLADQIDPDHLDATVDTIVSYIEHSNARVTLVLDDLHEIVDGAILGQLGRIVSRPPANLTIVITTRADPALPIGRLRAHGQLVELRSQDLAFTADEARHVFEPLDEATIATIVDHTEGWATGLRMLAVSTAATPDANSLLSALSAVDRDLGDFLAAEALNSLQPELQQFLVETSVLDEMCPQVCDAVLGEPGSLATLRQLARSQVFTELVDPTTNTYRYHRLFRDFLLRRAEELPPERLALLHCRAASWYAAADDPSATIRHAIAAGDHDLALTTIKANCGSYAQRGLMTTLDGWLAAYGLDRCRLDPEMRMMVAWVALNVHRYDEIEEWLRALPGERLSSNYQVQAHTIRSHRARHLGDLDGALLEGRRAIAIDDSHPDDDIERSIAPAVLELAGQLAGEVDVERARQMLEIGLALGNDTSTVVAYSGLALYAVVDPDRRDEAEQFADQALALASSPVLERFHQPVIALLVKSRVELARGRIGDATDLAQRAESIAQAAVEPLMLILARCQLARLAHLKGHSDEARAALRSAESVLGDATPTPLVDELRRTTNEIRFARTEAGAPVVLSDREAAVLRLLPHGLTRKEIGAQLFVSENTVKSYLTSLRHKLGVTGGADAIIERARQFELLD